jgi:DNA-binding response OmpR family regulator
MILVEADDDLATCVFDYFAGQYEVTRVADLEAASRELRSGTEDVLFADIDLGTPAQTAVIESLHRGHPDLRIVVTYLAPPPAVDWEARLNESADVVVRKPYNVLDVDRALDENGERYKD